jgi:hypothetical protein
MIGEAAVRRTMARREQMPARRVSEADQFSGVDGAGNDADIGRRKPGARGFLVHRLACAEASTHGSA